MPESAQQILETYLGMSADFWVKVLIATVVLLLLLTVLKRLAQVGQIIGIVILLIVLVVIGYKWVCDRSEPAFMTPAVSFVASFFDVPPPAVQPSGTVPPPPFSGVGAPENAPANPPAKQPPPPENSPR